MNNPTLKGFLCTLLLFAYLVGSIGGFGYAVYSDAWFIAVCVLVLALLAFPVVRNIFNEWIK